MALVDDLQSYAASLETQFGLPTGLLQTQAGAESSWNPNAQNGNARGLMQFMPATADQYGVDVTDPYSSLYGAALYDSTLHGQTGSWVDTLKAYGTTAGNSLTTNKQAQNANAIATAADNGQSFDPSALVNGMFGSQGMNIPGQTNPDGSAKNAPSGVFASITNWLAKEKYNGISILIGLGFVIAAGIKLMGNANVVLEGIAAGAEIGG